jgi:hypothetical protein
MEPSGGWYQANLAVVSGMVRGSEEDTWFSRTMVEFG